MKPGELARVRFAFCALGCVPVFLAGWLGWLQIVQAGELPKSKRSPGTLPLVAETADHQVFREEHLPAPRGTIVDRNGVTLAADCQQYEVRARVQVPGDFVKDVEGLPGWIDRLVDDVARTLVEGLEPGEIGRMYSVYATRVRKALGSRLELARLPASGPLPADRPRKADILLSGEVDRLVVVEGLRRLAARKEYRTVHFDFLNSFERVYPERELTYGIVGHEATFFDETGSGERVERRYGACGLESFVALDAGDESRRGFLVDGRGRPYFSTPVEHEASGVVMHSTLDLELQRVAVRELTAAAEAVSEDSEKRPQWGAMVLVDLETGDLLAAASWNRGRHPKAASFTPYQTLFEPGSVVKPLVLAYAHEVGALDWSATFDCGPNGGDYKSRIAPLGRRKKVEDDHPLEQPVLTPHGILLNSSNIGAAYVGLMLAREQWSDYFDVFGLRASLGLRLPQEGRAGPNRLSFRSETPLRSFQANSAISFSFGYELLVTPLHVARAYLRLFRGLDADLRLVRGLEIDGAFHPVPVSRVTRTFRPAVVDAVRQAMVDVVSPEEGATGRFLHADVLKETGIDLHGLVGGKTGTAVSLVPVEGQGLVRVRNASFVGFLPAAQPRWLAVCVLQKDGNARFYGGKYAAPAAVRALLQCQQLAERRAPRQEPPGGSGGQTRTGLVTPGSSGWTPSEWTATVPSSGARDTRKGGR